MIPATIASVVILFLYWRQKNEGKPPDEHATIAAGMNFEVQAQASGRLPQNMQLLVKRQGQPDRRYPMESVGQGAFRYTFLKPQTALTPSATAASMILIIHSCLMRRWRSS